MTKIPSSIIISLAIVSLIWLIITPSFGLGVYKVHYNLYAFHPSLIRWIEYIVIKVFGFNEFILKLPAIIATTYWSLASRILFDNMGSKSEVYLIDNSFEQYDIYPSASPKNKDLLFINTHFFKFDDKKYNCERLETLPSEDILIKGTKINTIDYRWCYNYKGLRK
ncbi:hypothetical protein JHD50_09220 [Sulfurimonas sp. MAG313]|nr:hypothetical protein [Sulfurimonas sp. MAG313]MDF1881478.1 hypothetical protein [Sulfurimonas sp. MAG313]